MRAAKDEQQAFINYIRENVAFLQEQCSWKDYFEYEMKKEIKYNVWTLENERSKAVVLSQWCMLGKADICKCN